MDDLLLKRAGSNVVIILDIDSDGTTDALDLDGEITPDTAQIVVRNATLANFGAEDFIF